VQHAGETAQCLRTGGALTEDALWARGQHAVTVDEELAQLVAAAHGERDARRDGERVAVSHQKERLRGQRGGVAIGLQAAVHHRREWGEIVVAAPRAVAKGGTLHHGEGREARAGVARTRYLPTDVAPRQCAHWWQCVVARGGAWWRVVAVRTLVAVCGGAWWRVVAARARVRVRVRVCVRMRVERVASPRS
jgi:hypothetical protein